MFFHSLSDETLSLIIDALPVRIFWKDRESRFLGCNKLFAADAGITDAAEFIGKTDFYFFHPEQARAFRIADARVMASGEPQVALVEELTLPNGETRYVETNKVPLRNNAGEIFGVLGSYQDVTDRVLAERHAA